MGLPSPSRGSSATARPPTGSAVRRTVALGALALPVSLGISGTSLLLPVSAADLHLSIGGVTWLLTGYGWGMAVSMPLAAALAARHGKRIALGVGTVLHVLGAAMILTAPDLLLLIAGRAALGGGAGTMAVFAMGAARAVTSLRARQRALVIISASIGASGAAGPVVGSLIADATSWRVASSLPALSLLVVPAVARLTADVPAPGARAGTSAGFDVTGAALLTLVVTALFIALQGPSGGLPGAAVATAVLAGLGAAATLALRARSRPDGFLPAGIRRDRRFVGASAMVLGVASLNFALIYAAPQLLAEQTGWSRSQIGAVLVAPTLAGAALSWIMGNLALRLGARRSLLPMAALAVTVTVLAGLTGSLPAVLAAGAAGTFASAAAQGVLVADGTSALPSGLHPQAVGLFNLTFQFGSVVGPSVLAALAPGLGVGRALAVAAALPLVAAAVGPRRSLEQNHTVQSTH
jgi:MFS transporter, DHA2 family, metal-tetracycline-proton antiporter